LTGCTPPNPQAAVPYTIEHMIYEGSFELRDTADWVAESEVPYPLGNHFLNGALDLDVPSGITVWNRTLFKGNVMFEFEATVVSAGGINDRVSDLNCFWMATDPAFPGQFFERSSWRKGVFWNYYSLNLYYVGLGGHNNSKTRMRKYNAAAEIPPPVLSESIHPDHLIKANISNVIRIVCFGSTITYSLNGEEIFKFEDEDPYRDGYFGFRTVDNHMKVASFKVYSLSKRAH
jgi:rhamnogalacturonan endolyase